MKALKIGPLRLIQNRLINKAVSAAIYKKKSTFIHLSGQNTILNKYQDIVTQGFSITKVKGFIVTTLLQGQTKAVLWAIQPHDFMQFKKPRKNL